MSVAPRHFLQEDGRRTGPHSLAVLLQKAEVHVLTPETLVATEDDPDTWLPLREFQVLCSELLPERPHYTLGPRSVVTVNAASGTSTPSIDELLQDNIARQRETEGELLPPAAHPNQRRRDYLFLCIGGNALAALAAVLLPGNPIILVPLLGFMVVYNVGIAWVLFGVMGRY
ncbi:MAG: DUF4339 domain-containing protein [Rariglobus sp.]